jgi:hypothetical protein
MGVRGPRIVKFYRDLDSAWFLLICPSDNDFVAVADNFHVARAGEEDHRAWMFVDRGFVGNFFDIDIEDGTPG